MPGSFSGVALRNTRKSSGRPGRAQRRAAVLAAVGAARIGAVAAAEQHAAFLASPRCAGRVASAASSTMIGFGQEGLDQPAVDSVGTAASASDS